jgi:hypothetical protein
MPSPKEFAVFKSDKPVAVQDRQKKLIAGDPFERKADCHDFKSLDKR